MNALTSLLPPIIAAAMCIVGSVKGLDLYAVMLQGAKKGLRVMLDILGALLVFFPAVYFFRASGLAGFLTGLMEPVFSALGIPAECAPIMLLRPITGSGALSAASEIIAANGPDSTIGRTAAVMIGSSETTLYVISVYFGAIGKKPPRWALPAALCADLACFVSSALICAFLW